MFRLLGAAVLLVFAGGLVWGRCVLSEDRHAEALSSGASSLDAALGGDETAWGRAETAYGQAARASLLDAYPLWVLELIRAWRGEGSVVDSNPLSAVLTAACVQLDAATHNIPVQEYARDDATGVKADLVDAPVEREGGYLLLPQRPGIGIELNEEAFPRYPAVPYDRPPLINPDGSLREY